MKKLRIMCVFCDFWIKNVVVLAKKKRVNENRKKEGDMIEYGYEKDDRIDFIGFSVDVFWR